jgi:hypothetical protein
MAKGAELTLSQMQVAHDDLWGWNIASSWSANNDIEIILGRGFYTEKLRKTTKTRPLLQKSSVRNGLSAVSSEVWSEFMMFGIDC